ncbi:hypothetical protein N657DRAFT_130807 [Parathielavia appendiculata]|uniref:Uncharacterized protein n=1 Tax=Parathielavia appendiculata TaxID=2587402 RepID=A0AAN6Z0W8_9PEZI|nr:hypothetical protein N657DRAFT_130807 [Parathielavia appendiculata]
MMGKPQHESIAKAPRARDIRKARDFTLWIGGWPPAVSSTDDVPIADVMLVNGLRTTSCRVTTMGLFSGCWLSLAPDTVVVRNGPECLDRVREVNGQVVSLTVVGDRSLGKEYLTRNARCTFTWTRVRPAYPRKSSVLSYKLSAVPVRYTRKSEQAAMFL